jgi:fructose-bisphosphate aldolase, class I
MKKVSLSKLMNRGKTLILAYDQGLEHGPESDFNDKNADPLYIIDIAKKGRFSALAVQKGIAEKYNKEIKASKVPLILKLNGKTKLSKGEPMSTQLCSVKEAIQLGATAVGYTIYLGSLRESEMLSQFEEIQEEAHDNGLPVVAWMYPRGKNVSKKINRELMSYSARAALELGVDVAKIQYTGNPKDAERAVQVAGRCKIVISGGTRRGEKEFLDDVNDLIHVGVSGFAIGRNIWQHPKPMEITKKIKKVMWR